MFGELNLEYMNKLFTSLSFALMLALTSVSCTAQDASTATNTAGKPAAKAGATPPTQACDPTGENPYKPCPEKGISPEELAAAAKEAAATLPKRLEALKAKTLKSLIFVQGGTFTMGDFGPLVGEKLQFSFQADDNVLHEVMLDSFSLSAYKVTYQDFDVYTDSLAKPRVGMGYQSDRAYRNLPGQPAGINWYDAQAYCQWLGKQVGTPMDLPTEAQWEYAARNRGQMVVFATDTGQIDDGRNLASYEQRKEYEAKFGGPRSYLPALPIGKYPPTPMGFYDMLGNGHEWAMDWYVPSYENKKSKNPTGPSTGKAKVLRASEGSGGDSLRHYAMTFVRHSELPNPKPRLDSDGKAIPGANASSLTFARCVATSTKLIAK